MTGEVFLGLSIGCARCHDHKFDPILQKDYYRLQAFFTPLLPRDDLPLATPREQAEYAGEAAAWEPATAELRAQIAAIEQPYPREGGRRARSTSSPTTSRRSSPSRRPSGRRWRASSPPWPYRQVVAGARQASRRSRGRTKARWERLQRQLADVRRASSPRRLPTRPDGDRRRARSPRRRRSRASRKREPIAPGFLSVLDPAPAAIEPPPDPADSTGRRLALARWLSRPDNPLIDPGDRQPRLAVPLRPGAGRPPRATSAGSASAPSHPELLDWLARRVRRRGLAAQAAAPADHDLGRLSPVGRAAESEVESARRIDPENRLLWKADRPAAGRRGDPRRDAGRHRASSNRRVGGPSVDAEPPRRSIDTKVIRNSRDPLLDAFDAPDGYTSAGRRNVTTTPTQALLLINGDWTLARAGRLPAGSTG